MGGVIVGAPPQPPAPGSLFPPPPGGTLVPTRGPRRRAAAPAAAVYGNTRGGRECCVLDVLDSAIKYTATGGRVRLDVAGANGARSVVVTDTGIGIPADQLPHVFERFYRGEAARHEAEGTGLGLAIARWIADLHGAQI